MLMITAQDDPFGVRVVLGRAGCGQSAIQFVAPERAAIARLSPAPWQERFGRGSGGDFCDGLRV